MNGTRLRERREQLKMTQEELSKKTNLSRQTISALENGGKADVKVSTIKVLAAALKCKPSYLFFD